MIKSFKTDKLLVRGLGNSPILRETPSPTPLRSLTPPHLVAPSSGALSIPSVPLYLSAHNSPPPSLARLEETADSRTMKLALVHELFRRCADPALRFLQRNEANSLCQEISFAEDGLVLKQVAKVIQIGPEILQKELLRTSKKTSVKLAPFLPQLPVEKMAEYNAVLSPHGIYPLLQFDRLLTVLVELPLVLPLALRLCQENQLPIQWCHGIPTNFGDLDSFPLMRVGPSLCPG